MHPLAEMSLALMEERLVTLAQEAAQASTPMEIHLAVTRLEACRFGIKLHHDYLVRQESYPV